MIIWSVWGVVLLVIILSIIIIIVERRSIDRGIIVSSNYRKLLITGITIVLVSIIGMAVLFVLEIPVFIGTPILGMGIVFVVAGLVYRKEWIKWVHSYSELERRYSESERRYSESEKRYSELLRKIDELKRR